MITAHEKIKKMEEIVKHKHLQRQNDISNSYLTTGYRVSSGASCHILSSYIPHSARKVKLKRKIFFILYIAPDVEG